ncbi:hypothetical protein HD806DRAFT_523641 [Xylariaceae sp. AK1471]|nr:hypothetical protein HD806DRAFT_523641 [Xylariaceae sp. AK1471]
MWSRVPTAIELPHLSYLSNHTTHINSIRPPRSIPSIPSIFLVVFVKQHKPKHDLLHHGLGSSILFAYHHIVHLHPSLPKSLRFRILRTDSMPLEPDTARPKCEDCLRRGVDCQHKVFTSSSKKTASGENGQTGAVEGSQSQGSDQVIEQQGDQPEPPMVADNGSSGRSLIEAGFSSSSETLVEGMQLFSPSTETLVEGEGQQAPCADGWVDNTLDSTERETLVDEEGEQVYSTNRWVDSGFDSREREMLAEWEEEHVFSTGRWVDSRYDSPESENTRCDQQ